MPSTTTSPERLSLSQHVVYTCSRLLAYGLPLFFFLVAVSFYLKTYDSAQIKITFTQVGATFLALIWIIRMLVEGRFPFSRSDMVFVGPFLAFLASGLIAYLDTPFKGWSLEETLRRVFYMLLALVTIAEFRSTERTRRLWRWLMAAAWVSIGYGLLQYIDTRFYRNVPGIDPFIWRQAFGPRVFSTFGNPNFYGNFLVILTPLIMVSVLRARGSLSRPFQMIGITLLLVLLIDKMQLGLFGGYDKAYSIVFSVLIVGLLGLFFFFVFSKTSNSGSLPMFLVLIALLFLNLYSTETKGAWVGFTAAIGATIWLIFEYVLHFEERMLDAKKYMVILGTLAVLFAGLFAAMFFAFVLPLLRGTVTQTGFQILWIPSLLAVVAGVATLAWLARPPWNLKKVIYGFLIFFILTMGAGVLQFAKSRLISVSFRLFTWIATWEMIQEDPILGNGVGTFKVIYPAHRRPQIIALEGRSNTETDHAEDEYLEVWQDEGIVGFGVFLWLVFTALILGMKQLRWYSRLNRPPPEVAKKRKMLELDSDPRSYEILGYLAAYMGALIHWFFDVSIRFVSSGIFSGFLPGVLVAYARNHSNPIVNEVRLDYDRWIRAGLAAFWTAVLLWLKVELVPQALIRGGDTTEVQIATWAILAGVLLFILLEVLEMGNVPEKAVPFSEQYPPIQSNLKILRLAAVLPVVVVMAYAMNLFRHHFLADVHHNMAIFFSKEALWEKLPEFDGRIINYPPDIREKYQETGGALDHYAEVVKKNPYFPMSRYFIGNVYNDWGSQKNSDSINALQRGNRAEAERLRDKAIEMWDKSENAYIGTKALAPNYVQTHHQMGLLYVKRAEQATQWGWNEKAKEYYAEALRNFELYRKLDPVFPPNYDRIVQILLMNGKVDESIRLYKEAIYYNDVVARAIHNHPFADRVSGFALALAKINYNTAANKTPNPFKPVLPEVEEAIKYFRLAAEHDPKSVEAWKGLAFLSERTGRNEDAQMAMRKVRELNPNDPDIRNAP